jgi:hypothetical protein
VKRSNRIDDRRMTPADFRRIALSLEGVEEYLHAGLPAFRVGGRKFASLASQAQGYGNLQLNVLRRIEGPGEDMLWVSSG